MILGAESVSDIFSVFHDGGISAYISDGDRLDLQIDIMYLAERVDPGYRTFHVMLNGVQDLRFSTWPKDPGAEPEILKDPKQIFEPELEILSGKHQDNQIQVICNQSSAQCAYCGGELYFRADSARVTDEGGREYSLEDLTQLSSDYWDEWKSNKG